jgi:UDP-N-acetylmuramoyl-tripeptide--D-alanyl-D-alanine ligase
MLTLGHVVEALSGHPEPSLTTEFTYAVIDSRQVEPGALFIALPGEHVDGHDYVADALEHGAAAVLVERDVDVEADVIDFRQDVREQFSTAISTPVVLRVEDSLLGLQRTAAFWRGKLSLRVVGITGSVGKSTTKELTAEVLSRRFKTVKNPGNLNNEIGLPLTLLRANEKHERAVLEMGFYVPGEIALLCDIAIPSVGVVTNISEVHLERAGTMDAIVEGKGELVEALPEDGVAVLNHDEPMVRDLENRTDARVFFYGLSPESDLWASEVEGLGLDGVRCVLHYEGETIHLRVPLLGRHSVHTVLRAAAVGLIEGLTWQEIVGGLQGGESQLRLVAVQGPKDSLLIDDTYNAAPTSVLAALNLLEELDGRRVAVLGDMLELGEYEEKGHRLVGARVAGIADLLITVGERARWIADEAQMVGMPDEHVVELKGSQDAITYLEERVEEGDVILVKGSRGMRMDRIVTALEAHA